MSRRLVPALLGGSLMLGAGLWLSRRTMAPAVVDHPRLAPGISLRDVAFFSPALRRQMAYRVLMPVAITGSLPVVYLLHAGGGTFRDWSNYTDVARLGNGLLLVAPQGDYSYYTDAAARPQDRYESYLLDDLVADVQGRFPAQPTRDGRAVIGVSMGGFGALKVALRRPGHCVFAGAFSAAIDVPRRAFSWRRLRQSRAFEQIFGPPDSATRRDNDPFVLARQADPKTLPFLHLTCGAQEGLLAPNREFAALLARRGIAHQFRQLPGGHTWTHWNQQLAPMFASLRRHLPG
jgi:putative tributyrin esterase